LKVGNGKEVRRLKVGNGKEVRRLKGLEGRTELLGGGVPLGQLTRGKGEAVTKVAFFAVAATVGAEQKQPVEQELDVAITAGAAGVMALAGWANVRGKNRRSEYHGPAFQNCNLYGSAPVTPREVEN
jgi:hypothetical protein